MQVLADVFICSLLSHCLIMTNEQFHVLEEACTLLSKIEHFIKCCLHLSSALLSRFLIRINEQIRFHSILLWINCQLVESLWNFKNGFRRCLALPLAPERNPDFWPSIRLIPFPFLLFALRESTSDAFPEGHLLVRNYRSLLRRDRDKERGPRRGETGNFRRRDTSPAQFISTEAVSGSNAQLEGANKVHGCSWQSMAWQRIIFSYILYWALLRYFCVEEW
jgi:hypothetical protein